MKKYLIAGLLVWLPLAVTIWVLQAVLGMLDGVFGWLLTPARRRPAGAAPTPLDRHAAAGARPRRDRDAARPAADRHLRDQHRRPVVAAPGQPAAQQDPDRQVDLQLGQAGLGHAVLEQRQRLPRGGAGAVPARTARWTIAFVTGKPGGEAALHLHGDYLSVYVPTTPNPTSGFFLMVPRADVIDAGDERRRGAEVRHLDGRRRAADADRGGAAGRPPRRAEPAEISTPAERRRRAARVRRRPQRHAAQRDRTTTRRRAGGVPANRPAMNTGAMR